MEGNLQRPDLESLTQSPLRPTSDLVPAEEWDDETVKQQKPDAILEESGNDGQDDQKGKSIFSSAEKGKGKMAVKMTVKLFKAEKKVKYDKKLCRLLDEYGKVLIALAGNVGSNQLQNIRKGLRGDSIVLMGKNTLIRRCIKVHAEKSGNQAYLSLLPLLVGNVGLIFTKGDLKEVSEEVAKYKVGAPARVGLVAPIDVVVPAGNTGLDPSQTSFFQVLNIPTKINKGTVEISTPVELIKKGDKVGSSEAALLAKLRIRPFSYGLVIQSVYEDGSVFSPEVLDLTEDDFIEKFSAGLSMVPSLSLAISYPTLAAAPHMFINAYKNVLAVAIATDYTFPHICSSMLTKIIGIFVR